MECLIAEGCRRGISGPDATNASHKQAAGTGSHQGDPFRPSTLRQADLVGGSGPSHHDEPAAPEHVRL